MSVVLQVFYNVELARFTLATGETPVLAFGRIPPGYILWIPLALFALALSFLVGGWAVNAGASLFVLFTGDRTCPRNWRQYASSALSCWCFHSCLSFSAERSRGPSR